MNIEIIFFTQLASIFGFLVALFVLYRLLVKQKNSTIELLKEKTSYLEMQLSDVQQQRPDLLVENISKRVKLLNEELRSQFERAEELMSEFFCPHCKAPMVSREFGWESVEYNGREIDVDHEHVLYECGLEFIDGKEGAKCGSL